MTTSNSKPTEPQPVQFRIRIIYEDPIQQVNRRFGMVMTYSEEKLSEQGHHSFGSEFEPKSMENSDEISQEQSTQHNQCSSRPNVRDTDPDSHPSDQKEPLNPENAIAAILGMSPEKVSHLKKAFGSLVESFFCSSPEQKQPTKDDQD